MKSKFLLAILLMFSGVGMAQVVPTGVITGTATNIVGATTTPYPISLQAQIIGCGQSAPTVAGGTIITNTYIQPAVAMVATIPVWGNDIVTCGGQNYTTYAVTWLINNFPAAPTATYRVTQGQTCNISDGSCKPINFVPPVISRAAGFLCPASTPQLNGFNADYTPNCTVGPIVSVPNALMLASPTTQTLTQNVNTNLNFITSGSGKFNYNSFEVLNSLTGLNKSSTISQTITQGVNTNLNILTSGTGKALYNGNELLTTLVGPIVQAPTTTQTVTQPINTNLNIVTSGTGSLQHNGTVLIESLSNSSQTISQATTTTLTTTVTGGTSTGMGDNTPLTRTILTDNSVLSTSGTVQGDAHLTPIHRVDVTMNGPNDLASYYNYNCNYTGVGATGNCIPMFFIVGNTAADKHSGIWGFNSIVAEHANTLSFGGEVNTFNFAIDGDILANGTYTGGPFFGMAATATSGTGFKRQQAAFIASNNNVGGTGGGWNVGLLTTDAAQSAVMCGLPSSALLVAQCITSNALGISTSSNNFPSVPSIDLANTWTGSGNGIRSAQTQLITGTGSNPIVCKEWKIDGTIRFDMCSDGTLQINGGSNSIYRCTVAGTLPAGALTSNTALCGASGAADTGLRTN